MTVSLRLHYSREEPAIWLAHLDMMRTFERAVRRAAIPVAYSSGFNPRPQLSFALPIGVGIATEDDPLDVLLSEQAPTSRESADIWVSALNCRLPQGLSVRSGHLVTGPGPSLMSLVQSANYRLQTDGIAAAVDQLMQTGSPNDGNPVWMVQKTSKGKTRTVDIWPLVLSVTSEAADRVLLQAKAGSRNHLRPDLFLQLLVDKNLLDPLAALDCAITRTLVHVGEVP